VDTIDRNDTSAKPEAKPARKEKVLRAKMAALERRCPQGCVQRDALAHAIADYVPPQPAAIAAPGALTPDVTH